MKRMTGRGGAGEGFRFQTAKPTADAIRMPPRPTTSRNFHDGVPRGAVVDGAVPVRTSSSAMRASPIACNRWRGSFCRQRCTRARTDGGAAAGRSDQSGSARSTCGQRVGPLVAVKGSLARQHFIEHAAEGPDVGTSVHWLATRLFGAHVRCCTENGPDPRHHPGQRDCGRHRGRPSTQRVRLRGQCLGEAKV